MTRDDIIRMAREAGAHEKHLVMHMDFDDLERFAALVAAAERDACAKVCEDYGTSNTTKACAQAIRARSAP